MKQPNGKPPNEKQDAFKEFVRRIVSVPKKELDEQEKKYRDERKKKRNK